MELGGIVHSDSYQRSTHNAQAAAYNAEGFEIGLHVDTGCANWSSLAALQTIYTNQLNAWRTKYTTLPSPLTNRTHCIAWADYTSQAQVELNSGIRLDTTYYIPNGWVQNRPGSLPVQDADALRRSQRHDD